MPPPPPRSDAPAPTDVPSPPRQRARRDPKLSATPPQSTPASSSCDWVGYLSRVESDANPRPLRHRSGQAARPRSGEAWRPAAHGSQRARGGGGRRSSRRGAAASPSRRGHPRLRAGGIGRTGGDARFAACCRGARIGDDVRAAPASPVREADEPATEPAREEPSAGVRRGGRWRPRRPRARRRRGLRLGRPSSASVRRAPRRATRCRGAGGSFGWSCDATHLPEEPTAEQQLQAPAEALPRARAAIARGGGGCGSIRRSPRTSKKSPGSLRKCGDGAARGE